MRATKAGSKWVASLGTLTVCHETAKIVAPHARAEDICAYIAECRRCDRAVRRYQWMVIAISSLSPWLFMLGIGGLPGFAAMIVFAVLWFLFGLEQCIAHAAFLHSVATVRAYGRLLNATPSMTPETVVSELDKVFRENSEVKQWQ